MLGGIGGMGSGVSNCAAVTVGGIALIACVMLGGIGGMGSGVSNCVAFAVRGVALAANMRSAKHAKRAVCFNI